MNSVVLIGRLTRDPDLRYLTGGRAVVRFTLAVDKQLSREKRQDFEARNLPTADFINIVAWGKTAELCGQYLQKGRQVAISGRIETGSFVDSNNQKRFTTEVQAVNVQFIDWGDRGQGQAAPNAFQSQNTGVRNDESTMDFGGGFGNDDFDFGDNFNFKEVDDNGDIPF